jgi:two-component system LytT family response regulator
MIRCICIDDEPLALRQIAGYIEKVPFLQLEAQFESALKAISFLQENEIDLMFVDIQMPDLNGMEFVKSLQNPPRVIFTTAYSEYAVEGFRVDAIDYLLKPISFAAFLEAAQKAQKHFSLNSEQTQAKVDEEFLFMKSEHKLIRVNWKDIKYVESMREYVRIHLVNEKPIMSLMSLKKLEEKLPSDQFMRVHRSYIVNLSRITTIERSRIIFDKDVRIPVSDQYKEAFQAYIDKNFI